MIQQCSIHMAEDLCMQSHAYLYTLYRPLIGHYACTLYEVMCAMADKPISPQDLLEFAGLSKAQYKSARQVLEQYMLLSTYEDEQQVEHIYYLYAPLAPEAFLKHDLYGRLTINNISAGRFQRIKELFLAEEKPSSRFKNISETLKADELEEDWTEKKEIARQQYIPSSSELKRYPFNWELFFRGMERTIPYRLRTKENQARIAYLANVYGISEEDMRVYVVRGIPSDRDTLDFDVVTSYLQASIKTGKGKKSKNKKGKSKGKVDQAITSVETQSLSPIEFYQSLLPEGSFVLPAEKKDIIALHEVYGFNDEVTKYLLEYSLKNCNYVFQSNYIRKVAESWHRAKIDTLEKAKALTESMHRKISKEAPMPDWYYQEDPGVADSEVLAKLQVFQKGV